MKQTRFFNKILSILILAGLLVQLSACGTIIYPDRRGHNSGRIDTGVAVMDGVGLLFFLVPGIIAYAVDFSTGAIYLPVGRTSSIPEADEIKVVYVNPSRLDKNTIKEIVVRETGLSGTVDINKAEIFALNGANDIPSRFVEMKKSGYQVR